MLAATWSYLGKGGGPAFLQPTLLILNFRVRGNNDGSEYET